MRKWLVKNVFEMHALYSKVWLMKGLYNATCVQKVDGQFFMVTENIIMLLNNGGFFSDNLNTLNVK